MAYIDHSPETIAPANTGRVGDYLALLKPRVMSLVVFTAFVGMMLAPAALNPILALIAIFCIAVGGGASGALNMYYDADIDAVMSRTRNRPIPSGRVERDDALILGLVLSVFSVTTLGLATNWLAGGLLAFTIFFYAVVYTVWLKRSTPQNIVIGGAAGAFPAMIGWVSVTGTISVEAVVLFLIVFLWTPPHFWALALYKQSDYGAAGIPMLPNVAGEAVTKRHILAYSVVLVAATLAPQLLGMSGIVYTVTAAATGAWFLLLAWRVFSTQGVPMKQAGKALFTYSLWYMGVIFLALLVDNIIGRLGWL